LRGPEALAGGDETCRAAETDAEQTHAADGAQGAPRLIRRVRQEGHSTMATECPQCGLINPPAAQRCDCGYNLAQRPTLNASRIGLQALLFSFTGRIGRSTYWLKFLVPYFALYLVLLVVDWTLGTLDRKEAIGLLSGIFLLLALFPSVAVGVKRCHDRDRSGWFLLVGVIPFLNLWLLIELGFMAGTAGPNRYGLPEPRVV